MIDWLKEKLVAWFGPGYVKSIARHIASALSGALGAYGYSAESAEPVIASVLLYLFAQALSFLDKKKTATELPPAKQ